MTALAPAPIATIDPHARWHFWAPTVAGSAVDAINRMWLATGSAENAVSGFTASYNGHRYEVTWNSYRGRYVAGYTWSGFNRIAEGSLAECLSAALSAYGRGVSGAEVTVQLRAGDEDGLALCEAECRLQPWSEDAVDAHQASWPWQARQPRAGHTRIANVCEALRMERQQGIPLSLFLRATSREEWLESVREYQTSRRAARVVRG